MKSETLSLKPIINKLDFLTKEVIFNGTIKKILLLANKLMAKILDPCNAKWHYQSFIRKKNRKSVKQSEITAYQPKPFENPNINYIK